jgi:ABC-type ATPase involved in cell division
MRLIVSMRRAGAAVVVATQDEALAASLAGPHWRMAAGRIALAAPGPAP